ncbi:hypothetical protein HNP82_003063 [Catenibacillus scindens]|uniref:DUF1836 domain-containing protein n=1 Tax=Catenibacillus scindens TaxID=673271 RepID=A0A7W8M6T0_9FIRM|nr:DUF1836 domain-containing protein [Catenibacillus scindens]MBB5265912.1 hypothetical protein [Catenibacillus scindens]
MNENNTQPRSADLEDDKKLSKTIDQLLSQFKENKKNMEYIRPQMLPGIDLYMDQVTTFMEQHLGGTKRYPQDKILTKTMINNYAKNDLLPPPVKKKYSKDHLLFLTMIYYLKNLLSMSDIKTLMTPVREISEDNSSACSLEDVYSKVFEKAEGMQRDLLDEIDRDYRQSRGTFEDKEDLDDFTFVCMLCYDIFIKKQLVEQIIDVMSFREGVPVDDKKHK